MNDMSVQTFRATHCGESFEGATGAKALEAHMKTAHKGARRIMHTHNGAPIPWKAPKAPTDTKALTAVLAKAESDTDDVLDWHTDEKAVPVAELTTGDVFAYRGRVYVVHAVEGDTLDLTMKRKASHGGDVRSSLTREQILSKTETVALVKRVAA